MHIPEKQFYGMIDRVVHEGEPELLLAPLSSPPAGLPALWGKLLCEREWRPAVAQLWRPMEDRLPRVCRALKERLRGVALLRTEEVPASLIYFFSDGDFLFKYRGGLPLDEPRLAAARLPADFLDFYRIHDGWVFFYSEDGGPMPSTAWQAVATLWNEVTWHVPPGEVRLDTATGVYRDGVEFALAYDMSVTPPLPLLCRGDGSVEMLLDLWAAIDRDIGGFLEELDRAEEAPKAATPTTPRHDQLLGRLAEAGRSAARLGGAAVHAQASDLLLSQALMQKQRAGVQETIMHSYRQALQEWCASIEAGGRSKPPEVLDMFGLANIVDDAATDHFVATLPTAIWLDDSLEALQAVLLFNLFRGARERAEQALDRLTGLTFDAEEPPKPGAEIVFRLLESLSRRNVSAYKEWRRKLADHFRAPARDGNLRLPVEIRVAAFDAVAVQLGMAPA